MKPVFGLLSVVALAGCWAAPARAAQKLNLVFFLVDDMGWIDSTPYGSQYYETPNIERLARRSMRFTQAYATPLCSPTRASLMTGQYSARHGITSATGHLPPQPPEQRLFPPRGLPHQKFIYQLSRNSLDPAHYTLAEALHDAGWRTGHFGKWHLGLTRPYWPGQQGFDVAFHAAPDPGPGSFFSPYRFGQYQSFPEGPPGEYISDRLTDEALRFIAENRERPFFLNLWHYGVHGPWGHKPEYTQAFAGKRDPRGKQANPIMASMLKSIDEGLGRILDQLDRLDVADRTVIVFMSDNGGNVHSNTETERLTPEQQRGARGEQLRDWRRWAGNLPPTNNDPLRGGKGMLYEGGIRVPLFVCWPGAVPPGSTSDAVVGAIDMYPTLLEILGVPRPEQQKFDGVSIVPALRQSGPVEREAYFTYFPHIQPGIAVRQGDWKLIRRFEPYGDYPTLRELFDLGHDPGETRNLAERLPEKVAALDALIDRFLADTGALAPQPNPAYVSLDEQFRQLDRDGDGKLTPAELGHPKIFERADANDDSLLTLEELHAAFPNGPPRPAARPN